MTSAIFGWLTLLFRLCSISSDGHYSAYTSSSANNTTNNTLERSVLPDFTRIVNFPDFLSRGRHGDKSIPHKGGGGERHCVMCGQSRRCSAAAASENASTTRRPKQQQSMDNSCTSHDAMSDLATHIIPRQNKGVCTVCDVAVWMFRDPEGPCNNNNGGLEIKWCKGCKNFRPWEAFGDKGAATKCARCRQRQRDKYATQKIESSRLAEETELKA